MLSLEPYLSCYLRKEFLCSISQLQSIDWPEATEDTCFRGHADGTGDHLVME